MVNALPAGDSIIYVIDRVLNPQDVNPRNSQINFLKNNKNFSIFAKIYEALDIVELSATSKLLSLFCNLYNHFSFSYS